MKSTDVKTINQKIAILEKSGKGTVNCFKKTAKVLQGKLSLRLCGIVDHLKSVGMKVQFVTEL